jgi:hypothetical protein
MYYAMQCNPPEKAQLLCDQLKAEGVNIWVYNAEFGFLMSEGSEDEDPFPLTFCPTMTQNKGYPYGAPVFALYCQVFNAQTKMGLSSIVDVEIKKLEGKRDADQK